MNSTPTTERSITVFVSHTSTEQSQELLGALRWYRQIAAERAEIQVSRSESLKALSEILVCFRLERELLEALLGVGRHVGVCRIRYYHYDEQRDRLLSADCAGHWSDESLQIRLGNIVKRREACPLTTSDSFVCLAGKSPTLFEIDSAQESPLTELPPIEGLRRIGLARGQCDEVFQSYRLRIDYPLVHLDRIVGKLSCDLDLARVTPRAAQKLRWFWKVILRTVAPIESLRASRIGYIVPVSDGVREEINATTTLKQLFDYCVDTLPKRYNIRHASFFSESTDLTDCSRLILRRTSYAPSRPLENGAKHDGRTGYYRLTPEPDKSITAFVALNRQSVRLQSLNERNLLLPQLASLRSGVEWMNKIQDSDNHTSFLAVPIQVGGRLLGVLRFTEKAAGASDAYFTDIEEQWLSRIANDYIGPKLANLQERDAQAPFCDKNWQQRVVKALAETFGSEAKTYERHRCVNLRSAMRVMFRDVKHPRHLYVVNLARKDSRYFRHLAVAGALEYEVRENLQESYALQGTLTGRAIAKQDWIYIHDIPAAEKRKMIRPLSQESASILACPIFLGPRGVGALVLHSDRHDIIPEVHGPLLRYVTHLTSGIITCRYQQHT